MANELSYRKDVDLHFFSYRLDELTDLTEQIRFLCKYCTFGWTNSVAGNP